MPDATNLFGQPLPLAGPQIHFWPGAGPQTPSPDCPRPRAKFPPKKPWQVPDRRDDRIARQYTGDGTEPIPF